MGRESTGFCAHFKPLYVRFWCILQVERPITMKKDGIQTRNRKLAAKAKKKRMHDFFKPLDPRFSAYTGMHGSAAGAAAASYLTGPMSQYYAGQMGQMSSFMNSSMPTMSMASSPMSHLTGLASISSDPLVDHHQQQQHQQQQQLQPHHHQQQSFSNGTSGEESLVGASAW